MADNRAVATDDEWKTAASHVPNEPVSFDSMQTLDMQEAPIGRSKLKLSAILIALYVGFQDCTEATGGLTASSCHCS